MPDQRRPASPLNRKREVRHSWPRAVRVSKSHMVKHDSRFPAFLRIFFFSALFHRTVYKEHPLDPGMKEEGYSFAIQLFRILAANKDICAALMGPNGDMAFVEKIEKLVEDAVLPELFTMFPQNVNDIKYAYAFCINGCVGMIKCWLTGDSDDTPEHMAYLTHNIVSEAPRNFAAKVLNSAQERTTV